MLRKVESTFFIVFVVREALGEAAYNFGFIALHCYRAVVALDIDSHCYGFWGLGRELLVRTGPSCFQSVQVCNPILRLHYFRAIKY